MEFENEKSFVCRTKYNLNIYRKYKSGDKSKEFEYEVTQLINSFLGLIIFIKEKGVISNTKLIEFIDTNKPTVWLYKYPNKQGILKEEKHNFKNYLRHLRNTVAHPDKKLILLSENKKIKSIQFKDFENKNKFETILSLEKIDELVELLSNTFFGNDVCSENGKMNE